MNNAERVGDLNGIRFAISGPMVKHLLFTDDSLFLCKASAKESLVIKRCLQLYGEASRHVTNYSKSSIIFGSTVDETLKTIVKETTGIYQEEGEGSYLGLPKCFSGSKRKHLNFIQEKLESRLHGWFAKGLSQGGKETLINSVALALSMYTMTCLKLSKDFCKKLTSTMIEYWWSNGKDKRKIHWVVWKKFCKKKREGGLGFQDISHFNQSLL